MRHSLQSSSGCTSQSTPTEGDCHHFISTSMAAYRMKLFAAGLRLYYVFSCLVLEDCLIS